MEGQDWIEKVYDRPPETLISREFPQVQIEITSSPVIKTHACVAD